MRISHASKAVALSAALALTLSACGGGSSETPEGNGDAQAGDTSYVVSANTTEPQNGLLPANTNEVGGGRVMDLIFTGLVSYTADGKTQNELAESIETTDSQNYTIKIKSGQTFSDGSPVTAASFVDAWNFGAAAKNAQLNSYFFESIKGYKEVSAENAKKDTMEGLKVVDDTTFTVELSQPESDFPLRLGYTAFFPLPEAAFEDPKAFGEKPVGNGPYTLAEWNHDVNLKLEVNEKYDGPRKAQNGGIDFKVYQSTDSAYQDLISGNLDVLDQVPPSQLASYQSDLGDRSVNSPYAGNATITIPGYLDHFKQGEEGNLRRAAISQAIDRQLVIDKVYQGGKVIAKDFTAPVIDGYSDSIPGSEVLTFNAEAAKKAWADADAISKWDADAELSIGYNVDGAGNKEYVEAVVNQLKNNLGINAVAKPYSSFKELREQVTERKMTGGFRTGWQADYPSLYNFLGALYGTGAGSNDGDYSNKEFDAKLKEGLAATDPAAGAEIFNQAQEILMKDLPAIPLWYQAVQGGWSENVSNVEFGWNGVPLYNEIAGK
ncbi:peptide ABC transporter substrate-binding protein [Glutamicibacter soli]|uniref:ABC transporter substrate-binding protein n=1 Tax=Glutamicibacter soli TaxID=453836 RepID=A0A365YJ19_9MICC|nr:MULTISPECIES: ABC transporter substrate-binding protein [Micrococcaceae]ALD63319.1 ABC transporter substrate-binding protein [Arthrobacter sp. LS16]ALQ31429.1 ABC transporter substrate-binding protein [Arthrobacter sp. YC-RL1]KLI87298.1 ABC transporter substrate-binding protein [Arthrobacter sp. YC-RL1]RBM02705.1 ABC transporter substrate-binding protein [Glutamicibacter soli]RKS20756.1 oligopeptide transport system substrate-binding protein [Arthrobacter sp. AG1021]